MKIIIATLKTWNVDKAKELQDKYSMVHSIKIINNKADLNSDFVHAFKPDYIFFPHWSYVIPHDIYANYTCIVFHMTDLPFGRGGSPLQNLIVRGVKETKLSAIRVCRGIDSGPVYFKEPLNLTGSAEEIYRRAAKLIFDKMIPQFFTKKNIRPEEQTGEPVYFERRTADQSELKRDMSLTQIYDYIRMLDAEGYPNAYIIFGKYKLQFQKAQFDGTKIQAKVDIIVEEDK